MTDVDYLLEQIREEIHAATRPLHQELQAIRRLIVSDQSHLDADVSVLTTALADIEAEVAALKAQPAAAALDFSKLDGLVATAKSADPGKTPAPAPAPTPAPPATATPAEAPTPPAPAPAGPDTVPAQPSPVPPAGEGTGTPPPATPPATP